jgi:hypothetical protein
MGQKEFKKRLFWNFAEFYSQGSGDAPAIGFVGLQAVADVSDFNFLGSIGHGASGVF